MVTEGKVTIFTDADSFRTRLQSYLEDADTHDEASRQLTTLFQTLLEGEALVDLKHPGRHGHERR